MTILRVRPAAPSDVPRLEALNAAAYPELLADGVVFDAAQLRAQQYVFPEGQLVVERETPEGSLVVGAIATLIVSSTAALAPHTWVDITSHGTFACHDPRGDALYLADVYVGPEARGLGVGQELYRALFDLCRRKGLARVVAGGRLWDYHAVASRMTAAEYADEVARGVRRDPVLGSQLKAGFTVAGILDGYLDDWRSASAATHLVWENRSTRSAAGSAATAAAATASAREEGRDGTAGVRRALPRGEAGDEADRRRDVA